MTSLPSPPLNPNAFTTDTYTWWHFEDVKTYSSCCVNVWMINWSDKAHLGWLKRISEIIKTNIVHKTMTFENGGGAKQTSRSMVR